MTTIEEEDAIGSVTDMAVVMEVMEVMEVMVVMSMADPIVRSFPHHLLLSLPTQDPYPMVVLLIQR